MSSNQRIIRRAAALLVVAAAHAAFAADPPSSATESRYQQERARCLAGQSGQAQDTCLKEAGAARQMARERQLTDADPKNAAKRCEVQSGDAKRDCLARANGGGDTVTSGSVKEGGVLRSTTTVIPAASGPR